MPYPALPPSLGLRAVLLAALTAGLCLVPGRAPQASGHSGADVEARRGSLGYSHRPLLCDFMSRFDLDFLNDSYPPPAAFDLNLGEIRSDRLAVFHTYALTDDPRIFGNVTTEARYMDFRAVTPEGSRDASGRFSYSTANNNPRLFFFPRRETEEDRIVFLQFVYHCTHPGERYPTWFLLTVCGRNATPPPPSPPEPAPLPLPVPGPEKEAEIGDCNDFEVTAAAVTPEVELFHPAKVTVQVRNLSPTRLYAPVVSISGSGYLYDRKVTVTQGFVEGGTFRHLRLEFTAGYLEPGASATLTVEGAVAQAPRGSVFFEASIPSGDCQPANNRSTATVQVTVPPRPDLSGEWTQAGVTLNGNLLHTLSRVKGRLQVRNDGEVDAPPARVAFFLSKDTVLGPEDRFLGFGETGAIPRGGAEEVSLDVGIPTALFPPVHLLAILDSSNTAFETDERNNLARRLCQVGD